MVRYYIIKKKQLQCHYTVMKILDFYLAKDFYFVVIVVLCLRECP